MSALLACLGVLASIPSGPPPAFDAVRNDKNVMGALENFFLQQDKLLARLDNVQPRAARARSDLMVKGAGLFASLRPYREGVELTDEVIRQSQALHRQFRQKADEFKDTRKRDGYLAAYHKCYGSLFWMYRSTLRISMYQFIVEHRWPWETNRRMTNINAFCFDFFLTHPVARGSRREAFAMVARVEIWATDLLRPARPGVAAWRNVLTLTTQQVQNLLR